MPFACGERTGWGKYLTQILRHELESFNYDRSCQTTMYIKVERMVCLSDRSGFRTGAIIAQHNSEKTSFQVVWRWPS